MSPTFLPVTNTVPIKPAFVVVVNPSAAFLGSASIGFLFNGGKIPLLGLIGGFWNVTTASLWVNSALYNLKHKSSNWHGVHVEAFCDLNRDPTENWLAYTLPAACGNACALRAVCPISAVKTS